VLSLTILSEQDDDTVDDTGEQLAAEGANSTFFQALNRASPVTTLKLYYNHFILYVVQ
jgi:hypothetical protein